MGPPRRKASTPHPISAHCCVAAVRQARTTRAFEGPRSLARVTRSAAAALAQRRRGLRQHEVPRRAGLRLRRLHPQRKRRSPQRAQGE